MKFYTLLTLLAFFAINLSAQDSAEKNSNEKIKQSLTELEQRIMALDIDEIDSKVRSYLEEHAPDRIDLENLKEDAMESIAELKERDYSCIDELKGNINEDFRELEDIMRSMSDDFKTMLDDWDVEIPSKQEKKAQKI